MTIQEILILVSVSFVLGWITRRTQRNNLLLIFSIVLIYWLQPGSTIRYLDFWLPTTTLSITIISWAITTNPELLKLKINRQTGFLILTVIFFLGAFRYLNLADQLVFLDPPGLAQIVVFLLPFAALFLLLVQTKYNSAKLLWVIFIGLIAIFVITKTPILSYQASLALRSMTGQKLSLASGNELRWLGFSYLAFRILHTIRDRQSGRLPDITLREYVTYVIFYPSFLAGPIDRVENFCQELRNVTDTFPNDITSAAERIIIGLFKKYVIADSLAIFSLNSQNFSQVNSALGSWVLLYSFSFQILFDFSGYTDIAIGLARLFNIKLPENFKLPYIKPNLTQFWNNWHMTLTNWFRSYFFNPLSRSMRKKKYPALVILFVTQISTMVLVGLWHGVTINFVIWGLWHGVGLLIQNRWSLIIKPVITNFEGSPFLMSVINSFGVLLTFHYVALGWIWFVLDGPSQGWNFLIGLFGVSRW